MGLIRIPVNQARKEISSMIRGVKKGERFVLSRHKEVVAAVVSVEDLALLQAIDDRRDRRAALAAHADASVNGTVPWDQVKADLGL